MKTMRLFAACCSLTCLLLSLAIAASAEPVPKIRMEPFLKQLLILHATVRGHDGTFIFDSGTGVSSITPAFAAVIGCKPWGQISGFRMTGQRLDMPRCDHVTFQIAGASYPAATIGVLDTNKFMPPGTKQHVDGTLGLDIFAGRAIFFSYSGRFLEPLSRASLTTLIRGHKAMPVHLVRDAEGLALTVNLPVQTPDGTAWFEMDSGNNSGFLLVGKHLAGLLKVSSQNTAPQTLTASLADGSRFSGYVKVLDLTLDGNLGTTFLSHYNVILDLVNTKAWVTSAL